MRPANQGKLQTIDNARVLVSWYMMMRFLSNFSLCLPVLFEAY